MLLSFKNLVNSIISPIDLAILRKSTLDSLIDGAGAKHDLDFLKLAPPNLTAELLRLLDSSHAQLRQDLFVLSQVGLKSNGYFVEFGATNGIDLSNTYMLEKQFGWTGILAEPGKCWHQELTDNRDAVIETKCVWSESGASLQFRETNTPELSTIDSYSSHDHHSLSRKEGSVYEVTTISLNDLLDKHNAPSIVDYLSIDTEGSEFEILKNFDFSHRQISVITCEHNHTPSRKRIHDLLQRRGYKRVFESVSQFDDWYVLENLNSAV